MIHDERKRQVGSWLAGYLIRFKRPDGFTDDVAREEMVEIAQAIIGRLPSHLNKEATAERLASIGREVNTRHKTRSWPQVWEFLEACDRAGRATAGATNDVEEFMLGRCEDWHRKFGEPFRSCMNESRALALLKRGNCGTAREMYEAGYPLPDHIRAEMGGPTPAEQQRRANILAGFKHG